MPFGSASVQRSRATYRPTVTPERSTHVDSFMGITSSFCRTAGWSLAGAAAPAVPGPRPGRPRAGTVGVRLRPVRGQVVRAGYPGNCDPDSPANGAHDEAAR